MLPEEVSKFGFSSKILKLLPFTAYSHSSIFEGEDTQLSDKTLDIEDTFQLGDAVGRYVVIAGCQGDSQLLAQL